MTIANYEAPESGDHNNIPDDLQDLADWALAQLETLQAAMAAQATPAGAIMGWDSTDAPATWHVLDGRAVSRLDNPVLFARYGTTHGAGNGITTFNLPNRKGRALVGRDSAQSEFDTIGKTGGAKTHQLTIAEMPSHEHGQVVTLDTDTPAGGQRSTVVGGGAIWSDGDVVQITHAGGGGHHNNLPPYAVTNWIIKAG